MISSVPIYDYRCDECGHRFSAVQSFNDAALDTCPNCGKRPRRLITAPAIVFKGSGWYKTDSRTAPKDSDGAASSDKSDKSEKDKSDKKDTKAETGGGKTDSKSDKNESKPSTSETKSDTKPAASAPPKSEAKS